jgi:hypothetical protein
MFFLPPLASDRLRCPPSPYANSTDTLRGGGVKPATQINATYSAAKVEMTVTIEAQFSEVLGSTLCQHTGYPEASLNSLVPPGNARIVPRVWGPPYLQFTIHKSPNHSMLHAII